MVTWLIQDLKNKRRYFKILKIKQDTQ